MKIESFSCSVSLRSVSGATAKLRFVSLFSNKLNRESTERESLALEISEVISEIRVKEELYKKPASSLSMASFLGEQAVVEKAMPNKEKNRIMKRKGLLTLENNMIRLKFI
ncbi:MAG: hypothetical protein J1F38_08300 [Muribaculaceae bacterium]|nr:hypothetical protein [Muribaculaceae bacterium]